MNGERVHELAQKPFVPHCVQEDGCDCVQEHARNGSETDAGNGVQEDGFTTLLQQHGCEQDGCGLQTHVCLSECESVHEDGCEDGVEPLRNSSLARLRRSSSDEDES